MMMRGKTGGIISVIAARGKNVIRMSFTFDHYSSSQDCIPNVNGIDGDSRWQTVHDNLGDNGLLVSHGVMSFLFVDLVAFRTI